MLVITLTDCPASLKGDLSKWMQEISTGVYVGQVGARVRDELWNRVKANVNKGRSTMVYSANNEQRMDFRVHNSHWEPIDFDGLKLMMRPSAARMKTMCVARTGYSKAAKIHMARQMSARHPSSPLPQEPFVVIDVETTGLSAESDEIIEIGALKTDGAKTIAKFHALVKPGAALPAAIIQLTGITDALLAREGQPLEQALLAFLEFTGELPIVSHNAGFDFSFLRSACARCGLPLLSNRIIDTLALARRWVRDAQNYKLTTLLEHLHIPCENAHRSREDCANTLRLYLKLIEIRDSKK